MLQFFKTNHENENLLKSINLSQAIIEFNLDGTIIHANDNFLKTVGYSLDEIKGKHHSLFVDPNYRATPDYQRFWQDLNNGRFFVDEFKRIAKGGREFWIQGSYNPVFNDKGKPYKVVKLCSDITEQKVMNSYVNSQLEAINRSQAVIEFNIDGTIIKANDNFLGATGYTLDEIKGKHHSMFVESSYRGTSDYQNFWNDLRNGKYFISEFKRIRKDGSEIWIQGSYNPIFDLNGVCYRVVKYCTDITNQVLTRQENEMGALETVKVLQAFSLGDLTQRIENHYNGTFKDIKEAFNATAENLTEIILKIHDATQTITDSSSEITESTRDLSQRTENQASSLEETAASMEELASTVRQNSESAQNANSLAIEAQESAEKGGEVMGEAMEAMKRIESSSDKISEIMGVIDEIAFQTNLLALNASVEAARAGDAGKGFAVVAEEVRSLAQRSATASKQIKELIIDSTAQVKQGGQLVTRSGDSLQTIVQSAKKVAELIGQIAGASREQSSGIEQINIAISQMDETTQKNAALVQENTAASTSLNQEATSLSELVQQFRIDQGDVARSTKNSQIVMKNSSKTKRAGASTGTRGGGGFESRVPAGNHVSQNHEENSWKEF